jgi:hypothetical protein
MWPLNLTEWLALGEIDETNAWRGLTPDLLLVIIDSRAVHLALGLFRTCNGILPLMLDDEIVSNWGGDLSWKVYRGSDVSSTRLLPIGCILMLILSEGMSLSKEVFLVNWVVRLGLCSSALRGDCVLVGDWQGDRISKLYWRCANDCSECCFIDNNIIKNAATVQVVSGIY